MEEQRREKEREVAREGRGNDGDLLNQAYVLATESF